ncbi:PilZ domain-containing protein [Desulfobotulus sp. H1]|uniref:PilZ domain-containing protein n=1 Tax=Desulfobotulus pelophilus TaxID=2823377 RepID=A0ABT3NCE0_9BACT|nr:PilZ domain-containing protein [Desulfobotulus pelophilus]MCW7755085.1 PilZ domain-containing protein [Desulfobotulus pelophilus]
MDDFREKRKNPRLTVFKPVVYTSEDQEYREYILDISGGGVFIKTRHILPPDTEIRLFLPFPGDNYISLIGVVVRSGEKGIAVEFCKDDMEIIHSLRNMIRNIRVLEE